MDDIYLNTTLSTEDKEESVTVQQAAGFWGLFSSIKATAESTLATASKLVQDATNALPATSANMLHTYKRDLSEFVTTVRSDVQDLLEKKSVVTAVTAGESTQASSAPEAVVSLPEDVARVEARVRAQRVLDRASSALQEEDVEWELPDESDYKDEQEISSATSQTSISAENLTPVRDPVPPASVGVSAVVLSPKASPKPSGIPQPSLAAPFKLQVPRSPSLSAPSPPSDSLVTKDETADDWGEWE